MNSVPNLSLILSINSEKGSCLQNREYIRKDGKWEGTEKADTSVEGSFQEYGMMPSEAEEKSPKNAAVIQHVKDGLTNAEIIALDPSYAFKGRDIDQLRQDICYAPFRKIIRNVEVHYLYGDSGTGKTRSIFNKHPMEDICRITNYAPRGVTQFDAYTGHPVLVFEEFHSQIPITSMLNFLDIYPVMLPARYFDRVACYTTVYITSNIPLEQQYTEIQRTKLETWNAFLRRIHTVTEFRRDGTVREVSHEKPEDFYKY